MEKNPTEAVDDGDGSLYLPEDVFVYEIFTRLPVRLLHRLRGLSKLCRSLPTQPGFLDVFRRLSGGRYVISFISAWNLKSVFYYSHPKQKNQIFSNPHADIQHAQISFINGLVCLVTTDGSVVIGNPATNEQFLPPKFRHHSGMEKTYIYFCHDPANDKYKILKATCVRRASQRGPVVVRMRFSIFTLGSDTRFWRNLWQKRLYQLGKSRNVCINGVVFITNFSRSRKIKDGVIAAFDVRRERFRAVRYPEGLGAARHRLCEVINVKGSLGVVDVGDVGVIRLWIKGDNWVERRIELPVPLKSGFGDYSFNTNVDGEMLFAYCEGMSRISEVCVFCYSMETGRWRRIEMGGVKEKHIVFSHFQIDEFLETPLSLRHILN